MHSTRVGALEGRSTRMSAMCPWYSVLAQRCSAGAGGRGAGWMAGGLAGWLVQLLGLGDGGKGDVGLSGSYGPHQPSLFTRSWYVFGVAGLPLWRTLSWAQTLLFFFKFQRWF